MLSKRAVHITGCLPLALRVFGSFLCNRNKGFWEREICRLEKSLEESVKKVLKISYDGLCEEDRSMFLYVACFFHGLGHVNSVTDVFDKGDKSRIGILAEKCLISISKKEYISMHDLVKQMGRDLGKHKILWNSDEIHEVLSTNEREARAIEAISLDTDTADKLIIGETTFEKVPSLKFLRICSSSNNGETDLRLPHGTRINFPELRYLKWDNYPSKILQFCAKNLVKLNLVGSNIEKLWEGYPCLENLKKIDVSFSENMKEFLDFSKVPNLEIVIAEGCTSLTEIPPSICSLHKLTKLDFWGCEGLQHIPNKMDMESLKDVCLSNCTSLKMYPESCPGVKVLLQERIRESELPESVGHLSYLVRLEIHDCGRLMHLPDSIGDLSSLKLLRLFSCHVLQGIPETICKLKSLENFCVSDGRIITKFPDLPQDVRIVAFKGTIIEKIPSSIGDLRLLEHLDLSGSKRLKNLPGTIYKMKCLKRLYLKDCPSLKSFPSKIYDTESCFEEHDAEETSLSTVRLSNLELLFISRAEKSDGLSFHFPSFSKFPSLRTLQLINLGMPEIFTDIGLLTNLENLDLSGNDFGMIPANIKRLTKLYRLHVNNCVNLHSLLELPPNIQFLSAHGCVALAQASGVVELKLNILEFAKCFKLLADSRVGDRGIVYLPGSEVPSCFEHRNKGHSLTIKLPCASSSVELRGFVACVVVEGSGKNDDYMKWKCRYTRENCRKIVLKGELYLGNKVEVQSGHMLFFNRDLRLKEDKDVFDQISFEFFFKNRPRVDERCPKVKECGVCMRFTPSSSSATCEAENNDGDSQDEVNEPSPSTKKQMKSFYGFCVVLFLFLLLIWAASVRSISNRLPLLKSLPLH